MLSPTAMGSRRGLCRAGTWLGLGHGLLWLLGGAPRRLGDHQGAIREGEGRACSSGGGEAAWVEEVSSN